MGPFFIGIKLARKRFKEAFFAVEIDLAKLAIVKMYTYVDL